MDELLGDDGDDTDQNETHKEAEEQAGLSTGREAHHRRIQERLEERRREEAPMSDTPKKQKGPREDDCEPADMSSPDDHPVRVSYDREDDDDEPQFAPIPPEVLACHRRAAGTLEEAPRGDDDDVPQWAPIPDDVLAQQSRALAEFTGNKLLVATSPSTLSTPTALFPLLAASDFGAGLSLGGAPGIIVPEPKRFPSPDPLVVEYPDRRSASSESGAAEVDVRNAIVDFAPELDTAVQDAAADLARAQEMTDAYWEEWPEEKKPSQWTRMTREVEKPQQAADEVMKQRKVAQASSKLWLQ